jgi:dihydrofolate synthase/folylpolyglutamate synthase
MAGSVQWRNAAAALAALEALAARVPVGAAAIRQGLGSARVAGRFQVIAKRPEIVLDVAHNPQAARALAGTLGERDAAGRTLAVVGMLADKDAAGVVDALAAHVDTWFVATPDSPRALAAARLAEVIRERCPGAAVRAFASPADALDAARSAARENDRIVVFGSFYTVAAALTHHAATEQ